MSTETFSLSSDQAFTVLARAIDAFIEAWESSAEPPHLDDYLPDDAERPLVLVELIKVDLEYRWQQRNIPKRIGEYFAEFPEMARDGFPAALIYEEFHIRRNCGFQVELDDYLEQFPDNADELRRLLGIDDVYATTSVYRPKGKEALVDINAGDTLDDFDLLAPLGQGAFAKVFLARQRSMQRLVALKISADSGQEPQTLAQFDHNNIVRVYDNRAYEERGLWLLYMQYCPGGTLQDVVRALNGTPPSERSGAVLTDTVARILDQRGESFAADSDLARRLRGMTWPEAVCWIGARLAEALEYAHSRGVLHRDIKPANVLLSRDAVPRLADFNISFSSKLEGASPSAYFGGSLAYMSVEQLEATNPACGRDPGSLDGRTDQYSLGVVLWELLTGRRPFADTAASSNFSRTLSGMAERRRAGLDDEARAGVPQNCPPGLVRVIERCLAADSDDRWPGGRELAHQLDLCRNREVQELLNPPAASWRRRLQRWATPAVILAAAVPNVLSGWFNWEYNRNQITLDPFQQIEFERIMLVINSIAYPLGLGLLALLSFLVVRSIRRLQQGETLPPERRRAASRWCLGLGHAAAIIGAVEWTIAGFAYPLAIHLTSGELGLAEYVHFLGSLVLCGLISAAYPFFAITCISLRALYPQLIGREFAATSDVHLLERLSQRCWFYLILAVSVPLASIVVVTFLPDQPRFVLLSLSGGTLVGFAGIYYCFRLLQRNLAALLGALSSDGAG